MVLVSTDPSSLDVAFLNNGLVRAFFHPFSLLSHCASYSTSRPSSAHVSTASSYSSQVFSPSLPSLMAEPSVKKKVYIVTNPGSDSDDSNEDLIRHLRGHGYHYRRPRQPAYNDYHQHRPSQTTPDHPPVKDSHRTPAHPILVETNESPTFEETPTAQAMSPTPSLLRPDPSNFQCPPKASVSPDPPIYYDRSCNENTTQQQFVGARKFPTPKPPFGSRPKPTGDNSRRSRVSPITAGPEPSAPSAGTPPLPTTASEKIVMVTADSDRYVKVDITIAKTALHIRELILNKLTIFDEDEFHPYSIYRTEIGSFAIGEALSNDNILALCRDQADSKGSLKFFVSVASAPAHETPSSSQPVEQHTIPPILPSMVSVNPLSYNKRRSRSRNGSLSSQSENKDGYDADLDNPDRDTSKPVTRITPQQSGVIISSSASTSQSQPRRRPSAVHQRPASPLVAEQSTPSQSSAWGHKREDKYVHATPPVLPAGPPPLSPMQTSFSSPDESLSSVLTPRYPPAVSNSDPVGDREIAAKVSEPLNVGSQLVVQENRSSTSTIRENLNNGQMRKPYDEDEVTWDPTPSSSAIRTTDDSERISPSTSRATRPQLATTSGGHFRATPPYNSRRPIPPPIPGLQDTRATQQRTGRQQPLPFSYVAYWKGEEVVSKKPLTKPFPLGRSVMKQPRSMDNLKLASPTSTSNWRNSPPALPTRPPGHIGYSPSSNLSVSGTPKSYEPPRGSSFVRPLPAQASPLPTSSEFGPTSAGDQTSRFPTNLTSPTHDPFPRPSSAAGDSNTSPTHVYPRLTSPGYGSMLDPGDSHRSPRAVSPHRMNGGYNGPRSRPNNYSDPSDRSSDIQSGPETSTSTPPRTPISPQSPRHESQEQKSLVFDPSLSSPVDNPADNKPSETITYDTRRRLVELTNRSTSDDVVTSRPQPVVQHQAAPLLPQSDSKGSYDDGDEESDNGGGTWIVPPGANPKTPRPQLNVQIEESTPLTSTTRSSNLGEFTKDATGQLRRDALNSKQIQRRPQSIFVDDDDDSWAPRPPAENIYDHLEKFFPTHDLDKPVIDTTSGDISPTTETVLPPPMPANDEKSRIRAKKSIRIVAQEHKKRIDRTSRADTTYANNNMLRKRNTKLWGSRLEEVTTAHSKSMTSSPESPSGGGPTTFKWVRGELIGKGTYGRVYLALNATTGEMIAVKQVELPQTASDKADSRQHMVVQALKSESETLRELDHPNIVQYLGFEETPTNLSIFLEYVPGGSIGRSLLKHGKFEDNVTKSFTAQILGGLEYLHSKGILHRDLKADNILVEMTGVCKISDFGISKRTEDLHGGASTAMQGTVFWMAPEVIKTQKNGYNNKIDIWSVGCVVLEMWAGMRPWNGEEVVAVMFKLYKSKQPPPIPEDVVLSEEADDFRRKCFAINPDDRPAAAELRKHPYLVLPPNWVFTGFT